MNTEAAQMREFCQKLLFTLHNDAVAPADKMKSMIVMLDQVHKRLTLLEGVTLQSLESISLE